MPERIAILKPSALGDVIHALPALAALRAGYPQAHIAWVVNKVYEPLIANHPALNATIPFDRSALKKGPIQAALLFHGFIQRLRKERFDFILDLQGLLRTGLMCAGSGAPRKIGFQNAREGARHFYTETVETPANMHAVDRYLKAAVQVGGTMPSRVAFHVPVKAEETTGVKMDFIRFPRPWVMVAVGSRWATKKWPPGHFAGLLRRGQNKFGGTVVFVGTSEDTACSLAVAEALPGPYYDATGKSTLPRLVAILNEADVMVANDTGPMHLAAALGRPCVAPYTCTQVARHGPYGQRGAGVETRASCGGSYLKQCPNGMVCLNDLTPDALWGPFSQSLHTWADHSHSA